MAKPNEVQLGDEVKDGLTGLKGIAIGVTTWLNGCRRITIQPQGLYEGKPMEPASFDEPTIEVLKKQKFARSADTDGQVLPVVKTGGPAKTVLPRSIPK